MSNIKRNLDTEESRDFWRLADETAAQVRSWPAWKRAGINVATERVAEDARGLHGGSDARALNALRPPMGSRQSQQER